MSIPPEHSIPDYLVIGHITRDLVPGGFRLGGTAAYSALTASRLGLRVGVYTACQADLPLETLEKVEIRIQDQAATTTFQNQYSPAGRTQHLLERAPDLDLDRLPAGWQNASIVHLAPVSAEVSPRAGSLFPGSMLVYSLQGWLRQWDDTGVVSPAAFPDQDLICPQDSSAFLSIEDLGYDRSQLGRLAEIFPLLVLTLGRDGAEVYQAGTLSEVPAASADEIDPTGAGDIFAAAFIIEKVMSGKSSAAAARFAADLAAISVTRPGLEGIPTVREISQIRKVH